MLFSGDKRKVLFTSDTGPEALLLVIEKYDLKDWDFLDVLHHGNKNNLTTVIMDALSPNWRVFSAKKESRPICR